MSWALLKTLISILPTRARNRSSVEAGQQDGNASQSASQPEASRPETTLASQPETSPEPQAQSEPDLLFRFPSRRSVVHSTRGIVACTEPLAAQAGLAILEAGGNAADAAVAVAAVLNVADPAMTGIGGDVFGLFYDASTGRVAALNGSGRSPMAATREAACGDVDGLVVPDPAGGGSHIDEEAAARTTLPTTSVHSLTVPGAAAGWVDTVHYFGSGRLSLADILAPAIRLAERGFPVSRLSAHYWASYEEDLRTRSPGASGCELLKPDPAATHGFRAPREGEVFRSPTLAATLRRLADHGKDGFYRGSVADAMVAVASAKGSPLSHADLCRHANLPPDISDALSISLDGLLPPMPRHTASHTATNNTSPTSFKPSKSPVIRLWEHPPNGQGVVALLAIGLLKELVKSQKIPALATLGHNTTAYLHVVVSALRIAFADAAWFVADPTCNNDDDNAARLLQPSYLAERAGLFEPDHPMGCLGHGSPPTESAPVTVPPTLPSSASATALTHESQVPPSVLTSDTVYVAVTDEAGNACSFVNSESNSFGSCLVPKGTGFAMGNRGTHFRLGPAKHPNVFAGGKRPYNTIIPALLTEENRDGDGYDRNNEADADAGQTTSPTNTSRHCRRLRTVFGVMGGFMQPQGHLQVLLNMEIFGLDPQYALDAPRICIGTHVLRSPAPASSHPEDTTIYAEDGLPQATVDGLAAMGYTVVIVKSLGRFLFGRGQVISHTRDPVTGDRVYAAGSDGRGDGHAVPL